MRRRTLLRGAATAGTGLLAGCAGWGGGDLDELETTDGTTSDEQHGPEPRLKGIIEGISAADNGSLVTHVNIYNIAQRERTAKVTVVANVNGTRHVSEREVTLAGSENRTVSFVFPDASRDEFASDGSIRNITYDEKD